MKKKIKVLRSNFQKKTFSQSKNKFYTQIIFKLVKSKLWIFEEDCLKTVGGDRLSAKSFF